MSQLWEVGHVKGLEQESMQMKYKKDDFSRLPVDSTGSTFDLIYHKAEPSAESPWAGASIVHFCQK